MDRFRSQSGTECRETCRRYLGTQRGHGGRRHPFGVGLRHRSGGAALRARFGQTARRRPRLRPREIRNAGHAHHRRSACRRGNQAVVERRHSDPRLHARPPSDTAGRRGAVGGRRIDRRQRSALSLHGARRPKGQQPLGRGQRMASPQRRALVGRHARRNRLRLFPGRRLAAGRPRGGDRRGAADPARGVAADENGDGRTARKIAAPRAGGTHPVVDRGRSGRRVAA